MLLLMLQPEGIRKQCLASALLPPFSGLGFSEREKVPLPLPSLQRGAEKRKSLWILLGALFIVKTSKSRIQPLSKHRSKQSVSEDGQAHLHWWSQPGGRVVAGEGGRSLS